MNPIRPARPHAHLFRALLGPLATVALIAILALGSRFGLVVPNPNLVFALALVWAAYEGGVGPGLASAALALAYTAAAWSLPGHWLRFTDADRQRLAVAAVCMPLMALLAGLLKARSERKQKALEGFLASEMERSRLLMAALERRDSPLGRIPVCAWCHRARNDGGDWESLESYLDRQHGVMVTHGICPDCRNMFDEA